MREEEFKSCFMYQSDLVIDSWDSDFWDVLPFGLFEVLDLMECLSLVKSYLEVRK